MDAYAEGFIDVHRSGPHLRCG